MIYHPHLYVDWKDVCPPTQADRNRHSQDNARKANRTTKKYADGRQKKGRK